MATALAATWQPATGSAPPSVLLAVTGAPSTPLLYASNFVGTIDGWTFTAGGAINFSSGPTNIAAELQGAVNAITTFSKVVAGLTIGQTYQYTAMVQTVRGQVALGVSGMTAGTNVSAATRSAMTYTFVATATSHTIQVIAKPPDSTSNGVNWVDTVRVVKTSGWQGTTIRRTDANGTSVVVREAPGGQDTTGTTGSATMTVTDYEQAYTGTLVYAVTDGNGVVTTAPTVNVPATTGVYLTLPATANPGVPVAPRFAAVDLITGFTESADTNGSVHEIIGRADPVANPGPLLLRAGTVSLWCTDYATAKAVRSLLAGGDVAQLAQPTFPAMDLYLVGRRVGIEPAELTGTPQRWRVAVDYQEVLAP